MVRLYGFYSWSLAHDSYSHCYFLGVENPKPLPLSPVTCSPVLHKADHRDLKYSALCLLLRKSLTYRVYN